MHATCHNDHESQSCNEATGDDDANIIGYMFLLQHMDLFSVVLSPVKVFDCSCLLFGLWKMFCHYNCRSDRRSLVPPTGALLFLHKWCKSLLLSIILRHCFTFLSALVEEKWSPKMQNVSRWHLALWWCASCWKSLGFMSLIERLSGSAVGNQTGSHALPRTVDAYTESVSPSVLSRGEKKKIAWRSATSGSGEFFSRFVCRNPPVNFHILTDRRCVSLDWPAAGHCHFQL